MCPRGRVCVCAESGAGGTASLARGPAVCPGRAAAGPAPVAAAAPVPPLGSGILRPLPPGEVKFQEESCSTGIKWLRPALRHGELF